LEKKKWLGAMATIAGILATVMGAVQLIGQVRLVDILLLYFGGIGSGAGLVKLILDLKKPAVKN